MFIKHLQIVTIGFQKFQIGLSKPNHISIFITSIFALNTVGWIFIYLPFRDRNIGYKVLVWSLEANFFQKRFPSAYIHGS